jgi:hypothetical protein
LNAQTQLELSRNRLSILSSAFERAHVTVRLAHLTLPQLDCHSRHLSAKPHLSEIAASSEG